jgi:hypothetical protein
MASVGKLGPGQQIINVFGGGGFSSSTDGGLSFVTMDDIKRNAARLVRGYSVKINTRPGKLVRELFVPLGQKSATEIKGKKGDLVLLTVSGTPENPKLLMDIHTRETSITNSTARGQCLTDFCLEDGQDVRILASAVFAEESKAPKEDEKKRKERKEKKNKKKKARSVAPPVQCSIGTADSLIARSLEFDLKTGKFVPVPKSL